MLDDQLRRRLEALNRGELPAKRELTSGGMLSERSDVGIVPPRKPMRSSSRITPQIPGLLRRGDVVCTSSGEHLRVRLPLESLWPAGPRLAAARQEYLQQQLVVARQAVEPTVVMNPEFAALVAALPNRVLLLDLETCGLAGAALFLVGLLRQADGAPTVELLVARDYSEEKAVLESLWAQMARHEVLVTFNGKSFDWPMVLDRSARYRLQHSGGQPARLTHVDVLHHARRRWRKQLPDCRLQTLEEFVCRRRRDGDIPGHQIPAAYAEYVRSGFERDMDAILFHNAVDLVTLFDLALRLAG